jgi:uncharacterized protein DUF1801
MLERSGTPSVLLAAIHKPNSVDYTFRMQSKAATVREYLASLPEDRRAAIQTVRDVILKNLDKDYEEGMQYGMIGYYVPHRVFSAGYHCYPRQPLPFASLASQKNHMSLGIMAHYGDGPEAQWFKAAWAKTGKKLDMGACCIRFKRLEDLPLDLIGEAIRRIPAKKFVEYYELAIKLRSKRGSTPKPRKKAAGKKPTAAKKGVRKAGARR